MNLCGTYLDVRTLKYILSAVAAIVAVAEMKCIMGYVVVHTSHF